MRVKFFMDSQTNNLEQRINGWLEQVSTATIIRTETRVTNVAEKANDGTNACIVVTIWYELPENR
jgi:hypothetical protein